MLRNVFYLTIKDFYPSTNGNWYASIIQTLLAMGILLDDRERFDRAITIIYMARATEASRITSTHSVSGRKAVATKLTRKWGLVFLDAHARLLEAGRGPVRRGR